MGVSEMDMLVVVSALALLARVGMAVLLAGSVRSKNAAGVMLRSFAESSMMLIGFWLIGYALMPSTGNGVLGFDRGRLLAERWAVEGTFVQMLPVVLLAGAIPLGATAERTRLAGSLVISLLLGALVVPIASYWVLPGGWLGRLGFLDVAGAGKAHLVGGMAGAVALWFVGSRVGKYNRDRSANAIPAHNVPLAGVGIGLMLVGLCATSMLWSELDDSLALLNTLLCGAGALLAALAVSRIRHAKYELFPCYTALIAGLVAAQASGDLMVQWAALLLGIATGVIVSFAAITLELTYRVDDVNGILIAHVGGAMLGLLAAGFVGAEGFIDGLRKIGVQGLGIVAIITFTKLVMFPVLFGLRALQWLRVSEADEYDGIDLIEHEANAYPDFQQTMIKSYHLREA